MTDSNLASEPDRKPLILVVDDEPSVRAMVLAAIRVRGPN
jgi:CheY-like chemotaxis protein